MTQMKRYRGSACWVCPLLMSAVLYCRQGAAQTASEQSPQAASSPDSPAYTEARRHFEQGRVLFESNNFDAALAEFTRAYEQLEARPNRYVLLFNIAQCHERLFRYDEAIRFYRRYLDEGAAMVEDRPAIEATIRTLDGLLATVRVEVNVPRAEVWVDNRQVGIAPGVVRIPGGRHSLEVRAQGHLSVREEFQVGARETITRRFNLDVVGRGISPSYFWVGVGATAASAIVGTIFGVQALNARSDVDARLASSDVRTRFAVTQADGDHIASLSLTADVFFAGAALFGIGSTVLFFMTDFHGRAPAQDRRTAWRTFPTFSSDLRGAGVEVSF